MRVFTPDEQGWTLHGPDVLALHGLSTVTTESVGKSRTTRRGSRIVLRVCGTSHQARHRWIVRRCTSPRKWSNRRFTSTACPIRGFRHSALCCGAESKGNARLRWNRQKGDGTFELADRNRTSVLYEALSEVDEPDPTLLRMTRANYDKVMYLDHLDRLTHHDLAPDLVQQVRGLTDPFDNVYDKVSAIERYLSEQGRLRLQPFHPGGRRSSTPSTSFCVRPNRDTASCLPRPWRLWCGRWVFPRESPQGIAAVNGTIATNRSPFARIWLTCGSKCISSTTVG